MLVGLDEDGQALAKSLFCQYQLLIIDRIMADIGKIARRA
jgi:hypothetical protein